MAMGHEQIISALALVASLFGVTVTAGKMVSSILALARLRRAIRRDEGLSQTLRMSLQEAEKNGSGPDRDKAISDLLELVLTKRTPSGVASRDVRVLHEVFESARPKVRDDMAHRLLAD
jgi:hypothetical protein